MIGVWGVLARACSPRHVIVISHLSLMSVLTDDVEPAPLSLVGLNLLDLQVFGFVPLVENDTNSLSRLTQCRRISCIIANQHDLVFSLILSIFLFDFFLVDLKYKALS